MTVTLSVGDDFVYQIEIGLVKFCYRSNLIILNGSAKNTTKNMNACIGNRSLGTFQNHFFLN